jgi:hypothetical protein
LPAAKLPAAALKDSTTVPLAPGASVVVPATMLTQGCVAVAVKLSVAVPVLFTV